jgi:hypothetical protein
MKNVKEFKTTLTGLIIWIATGLYFAMPYFNEKDLWEVNNIWVASGVIGGLLLILAPDRMLRFLFGFLDKKTNN